jgi:hypothetical protein
MLSPVACRPKGAGELQSVSIMQDSFESYTSMQQRLPKLRLGRRLCFKFLGSRLGHDQNLANAEKHIAE